MERILLKKTEDIEKLRKILESSSIIFYRAHIEVVGDKVYAVITEKIRK